MKRFFLLTKAIFIFIFPTCIVRIFHKNIGVNVRLGFSLFLCDTIIVGDNTKFGNFNVFRVEKLKVGKNVNLGSFNIFSGKLDVLIGDYCYIGKCNKISNPSFNYIKSRYEMHAYSNINVGHVFDLTHNVTISKKTVFAGVGTQVWTHSFYLPTKGKRVRVEKPIVIGENNYIGSRTIILAGVETANNIVVGAGSVVSKSLTEESALYVGQSAQMMKKFDVDATIESLKNTFISEVDDFYIYRR